MLKFVRKGMTTRERIAFLGTMTMVARVARIITTMTIEVERFGVFFCFES